MQMLAKKSGKKFNNIHVFQMQQKSEYVILLLKRYFINVKRPLYLWHQ